LLETMQSLTLRVIVRAVFGYAPGAEEEELRRRLRAMIDPLAERRGMLLRFLLARLRGEQRSPLEFESLRRAVDELIYAEIARRRDDPDLAERDDVFSALLLAEDEQGERLSDREVRDELVTLLLAGHETTASTLSWTLHLTSQHPDVQEKLREEARRVLGDRPPTFADLHQLAFTTQVVQEAMRLYPPVWLLPRLSLAEDNVGGWRVPAGSDVVVCPYTMHRNPEFWADPERFDPDRFHPDNTANRSRYAYIPFGAGPRFCVGNSLGMMEAVFVIAMISRELTLLTKPGYQVVPEPMMSLRVKGGLPMTVHRAPQT
jgi:cytochrome P450